MQRDGDQLSFALMLLVDREADDVVIPVKALFEILDGERYGKRIALQRHDGILIALQVPKQRRLHHDLLSTALRNSANNSTSSVGR